MTPLPDPSPSTTPFLTAAIAGMPGEYKRHWEDFRVEEIPVTAPAGSGDHVWLEVEKRGLSTDRVARALVKALDVPAGAVGYAGRKDARGVTVQWMSVAGVEPARALALELPRVRVLRADRHPEALSVGRLAGNRFTIVLRGIDPARRGDADAVLATLARRGVPNYFGEQRFGSRGDTGAIGRALLLGDPDEAVRLFAGAAGDADRGPVRRARELFDRGRWRQAARAFPHAYAETAAVARAMARSEGDAAAALRVLSKRTLQFLLSAYQGHVFNRILGRRVDALDRVLEGDWVRGDADGRVFAVEDPERVQPRVDAFELSPTAPLFGRQVGLSPGAAGCLEQEVLADEGVVASAFAQRGRLGSRGDRRPLRFRAVDLVLEELPASADAGAWRLTFALPPGCYATSLLRELLKDGGGPQLPAAEAGREAPGRAGVERSGLPVRGGERPLGLGADARPPADP